MFEAASLLSLALTVPTIFLALAVVVLWLPAAVRAIRTPGEKAPQQWFVVGVVVAFIGGILDNTYWEVAWAATYIDSEAAPRLMRSGVFFNIFFRQATGILAAYCHLRAARDSESRAQLVTNIAMVCSYIGAAVLVVVLVLLKGSL